MVVLDSMEYLIGFHGDYEPVDRVFGAAKLSNFAECQPFDIELNYEGTQVFTFTNVEAAYHSTKYPAYAKEFATMSGKKALKKARALEAEGITTDPEWGGFYSKKRAMLRIVRTKFSADKDAARLLLATKSAVLMELRENGAKDKTWSDGGDGRGDGWLGAALMMIRGELPAT
eukprot:2562921-Amphidinium_carterae.1